MTDTAGLAAFSLYLPMRDGVRLAVEVIGAAGFETRRAPVVAVFTRYGRATLPAIAAAPFSESQAFAELGFVVVSVDVRGTGASFGRRQSNRGLEELEDCRAVFDWAAREPWSNGQLFCTGVSYGGNIADMTQALDHPALVAVAPRFTDFDLYEHLLFPGGIPNVLFAKVWGELTAGLDRGEGPAAYVDGDDGGALYRQALAERAGGFDFLGAMARAAFREDIASPTALNHLAATADPVARPAFHWASWMDAGTAAGALERFQVTTAPMRVRIGAWSHGARDFADPFGETRPLTPTERAADIAEIADFFRSAARSPDRRNRVIEYATLGRPGWTRTNCWPPAGLGETRLWLAGEGRLSPEPPNGRGEGMCDRYEVDFDVGSGALSRWSTQIGAAVSYPDRRRQDLRLLTYDSAPLAEDVEITGAPSVSLYLASDRDDGMVVVYLEAVSPDGVVTYLTEGELRLRHAEIEREGQRRAFNLSAIRPIEPGVPVRLEFDLLPISALLRKGQSLRVGIAGADRDTFVRLPAEGTETIWLHRSADRPSSITLPTGVA